MALTALCPVVSAIRLAHRVNPGERRPVLCCRANSHQPSSVLPQPQQTSADHNVSSYACTNGLFQRQAAMASLGPKPALILSSATSAAGMTDATYPTAFAHLVVGAALAMSTVYALVSSPAATSTGTAFLPSLPASASADVDGSASPLASSSTTVASTPSISALPILRSAEQFNSFVRASNRAGYLAIVLFHAPWCSASIRMEKELQSLHHLVANRRVVFARVDCSIKQEQPLLSGESLGLNQCQILKLERCDLAQFHRIHKTPTIRMYYHNSCVDEVRSAPCHCL